jgi:hypothetical protein
MAQQLCLELVRRTITASITSPRLVLELVRLKSLETLLKMLKMSALVSDSFAHKDASELVSSSVTSISLEQVASQTSSSESVLTLQKFK